MDIPPCACGHAKSLKYCSKCQAFLCKDCLRIHSSVPFLQAHTVVVPPHAGMLHLLHKETIKKEIEQQRSNLNLIDSKSDLHATKQLIDSYWEVCCQLDDLQISNLKSLNSRMPFFTTMGSKGSGKGQLHYPCDVAVDVIGNVHVADSFNDRVVVFNSQGTFLRNITLSECLPYRRLTFPIGVTVAQCTLLVTETKNDRIVLFNLKGLFLGELELKPQVLHRSTVGCFNRLFCTDRINHRVVSTYLDGRWFKTFGSFGSGKGQLNHPYGIAVDGDSRLLVADQNNHRVVVFDTEGNFIRTLGSQGSGDGELNCPRAVALDRLGNIYVADFKNHRIVVFDPAGYFLLNLGSKGSGEGELNGPSGVVVDRNGAIYVADLNNHRIVVFCCLQLNK